MSDTAQGKHTYAYPRPAVTVDIIVATREKTPQVLLIRRKHEPFTGHWALPGGFVDELEPLIQAAKRELLEETGVSNAELEQLHSFGDPGRDPRGWTISVAYLARVEVGQCRPIAADDAAEVGWFALNSLPTLAFDHARILQKAAARIADREE